MKAPKPFAPSEDHECKDFVRWLDLKISQGAAIKFSHLPLETPTSAIQAARLKLLGVRRGVPDYLLIVRNKLVFIEMKKTSGGVVSVQQRSWLDALSMAGAGVHVCNGAREAKAVVSNLLDDA